MSRLLVITRPSLLPGFHLAGVQAFSAEDAEAAEKLIAPLLEEKEAGLLAIDDGLLAGLDPAFQRKLAAAEHLPYLALPGGEALSSGARRQRIAELIRRAIGFRITFRGEAVNR